MKRIAFLMVVGLLVVVGTTVFGVGAAEDAEERIVLRVGHGHPADFHYQKGMEVAKEQLEAETDGRITMEFFPNAALGDEAEMLDQVAAGTLDIAITGLTNLYYEPFALFDFPYQYENRDQVLAVMYSELMEELNEEGLIPQGLRNLGIMEVGFRNVTSNFPITTPEDLRGFDIRTPEDPAMVNTFEAFGANPTPMGFEELYGALQTGVVDGQENPMANIHAGGFYEVQDYVNLTRHIYNFAYVTMSEQTWQSLSPEDQQLVANAIERGSKEQVRIAESEEADYEQRLIDQGMEIVEIDDIDAFREIAQAAYDSQFVRDLGERGQQIIVEIRRIVEGVQ